MLLSEHGSVRCLPLHILDLGNLGGFHGCVLHPVSVPWVARGLPTKSVPLEAAINKQAMDLEERGHALLEAHLEPMDVAALDAEWRGQPRELWEPIFNEEAPLPGRALDTGDRALLRGIVPIRGMEPPEDHYDLPALVRVGQGLLDSLEAEVGLDLQLVSCGYVAAWTHSVRPGALSTGVFNSTVLLCCLCMVFLHSPGAVPFGLGGSPPKKMGETASVECPCV